VAARFPDLNNRGDTAGAATVFTDDAVLVGGAPCSLPSICKGPAAIAKRIENAAASHIAQTIDGPPAVAGNQVFMRLQIHNDLDVKAGIERHMALVSATVQGDKIASWLAYDDLRDAQTAKYSLLQQSGGGASQAASIADSERVAVARQFQDATARGDADAAAAAFSDNAVFIGGPACPPTAPCATPAAILKRAQAGVGTHNHDTLLGTPAVVGDLVQMRLEVRGDLITAAGAERVIVNVQEQLRGQKIASLVILPDITDAQTAKYQLFLQQQAGTKP